MSVVIAHGGNVVFHLWRHGHVGSFGTGRVFLQRCSGVAGFIFRKCVASGFVRVSVGCPDNGQRRAGGLASMLRHGICGPANSEAAIAFEFTVPVEGGQGGHVDRYAQVRTGDRPVDCLSAPGIASVERPRNMATGIEIEGVGHFLPGQADNVG